MADEQGALDPAEKTAEAGAAEAGTAAGADKAESILATAGEGAAESEAESAEAKAEQQTQEVEIKLPEDVELDPDLLAALKGGKPQEIADAYLKAQEKGREGYIQQQKAWVEELRNDKEFGGEGFQKNLGLANRALQKFGDEGLVGLLKDTGLSNNPHVIRLFHRLAVADAEDTVTGTAAAPPKSDHSDRLRKLYDNSPNLNF